jgi:hypothetical protein
MEKEYDVVELENGIKLPVVDAINYKDRTFLLVGILNEEQNDIEDNLYVYEKINDQIVEIEDNDLLEKLMQTFEKRIGK